MPLAWSYVTLQQQHRLESVYILFGGDDELLEYFFNDRVAEPRLPAKDLLRGARKLGSEHSQLIRAALDIWNGGGRATVADMLKNLSDEHLTNFIKALCHLREIREPVLHGLIDIENPSFHV
jgi:hypothetical protein